MLRSKEKRKNFNGYQEKSDGSKLEIFEDLHRCEKRTNNKSVQTLLKYHLLSSSLF